MRGIKSIAMPWLLLFCFIGLCRAADTKLDPEHERQTFNVAPGWQVNLFAADPAIEKPIEINWDNRGRLWCATSRTYPQVAPGQTPDDRIIILEDTTGSGRADKSTVFADHLFLPNAVAPGDGGAYVTNSTEILHIDEVGNTGVGSTRRVVLSGFGTEDTHHIVHTLRWGFDGRLYFNQSIYIHSHIETPWGEKTLLGSGTWRFEPQTMRLDVLSHGMVNPWGTVFDSWGRCFGTDGAGSEGIGCIFPGVAFTSAVGFERTMPGLTPGSPKYCGEEILDGRQIPADYQGDILTNDFRAHRIVRFKLSPEGAGFAATQMPDFITSKDPAFRPVDIKMGPDGAIYIADWYNPIIQHGEVDFRDPRRDHLHGRIWRVTAPGRPLVERPHIAGASISELLELLNSPEEYARLRAKLELRERPAAQVVPLLADWVKSQSDEHSLLEALWTYQTINTVEPNLLGRLLKAHDPRTRAAAVRVAWRWMDQLPDAQSIFSAAVTDDAPAVRLEGICALTAIPQPQSMVIACKALDRPRDKFIDYALWLAANQLKDQWLPAVQSRQAGEWDNADHLMFALEAVKAPQAVDRLVEQLKSGKIPPESRASAIDMIASIRGNTGQIFDLAIGPDVKDPETKLLLLSTLQRAAVILPRPDGDLTRLSSLFADRDETVRAAALRLAGTWKLEAVRPRLEQIAEASDSPPAIRLAAMDALAAMGGTKSIELLQKLSDATSSPAVRREAIGALLQLSPKDAAARAAAMLVSGWADDDPGELLAPFLQRENGDDELAAALSGKTISADTARLSLRFLQTQAGAGSSLIDLLEKSAGFSTGPTKLTPDQMRQMVPDVAAHGDPARGELVFRRRETGCYQCHAIDGVGGFLAPDLGSIGGSAPVDYLVDSVLDPNKAVKDGYMGYTIVTKDGDVINGIKVRQDKQELVLRDNLHEEIRIPIANVRREKEVGSLMPTGLADTLTHGEFLDLIAFLSNLGKPGPFGPAPPQVVRRWQIVAGDVTETSDPPPDKAAWSSLYSLVDGELPIDSRVIFVRCQLNVTLGGVVGLRLNSTDGIRTWIDGAPLAPTSLMTANLSPGVHTVTFRIDGVRRVGQSLLVGLADQPGSTAHAEVVGGR